MMPPGRRGFLSAILIATGLFCGACAELIDAVAPEASAISETPQPASYLSLGNKLLAAREPDLAMKAFLSSMSVEGITVEAMTGAGIAAQQQGLLITARRYFEQASQLAPDSVIAHNNLGVVLYTLKEYYPAREEFKSAFALSSGRSERAMQNLDRAEAAIARIEKIPETDGTIAQEVISRENGEFQLIDSASPEADEIAE